MEFPWNSFFNLLQQTQDDRKMFDGSFRAKRQIRLGGRTRKEDKNLVLQRAREQREERAKERRRLNSAIKLQALWRSALLRMRQKRTVQDSFERKLADIKRLKLIMHQTNQHFGVPVATLLILVREYLFSYDWKTGQHSRGLSGLCDLLYASVNEKETELNYLAYGRDPSRIEWMYQMKQLLRCCLHTLVNDEFSTSESPVAGFFNAVVCTDHWKLSTIDNLELSDQSTRIRLWLCTVKPFSIFDAFEKIQTTSIPLQVKDTIEKGLQACMVTLCSSTPSPALSSIASRILSIPFVAMPTSHVWKILPEDSSTFWIKLLSNLNSAKISGDKLIILDNILTIMEMVSLNDSTIVQVFASTITSTLDPLVMATAFGLNMDDLKQNAEEENDGCDVDAMEIDEDTEYDVEKIAIKVHRKEAEELRRKMTIRVPEHLAKRLQSLAQPRILRQLFTAILETDQPDLSSLCNLCRIYREVIANFGVSYSYKSNHLSTGIAATILNDIAFTEQSHSIIRSIWRALNQQVSSLQDYAVTMPELQHVFYVLFAAFSHALLALDDQAFYEDAYLLSFKEIHELVLFLRELLFKLYWNNTNSQSSTVFLDMKPGELELLLIATRLYNQLYDRNSRRSFCTIEEWHWPHIPVAEMELVDGWFLPTHQMSHILKMLPQVLPFRQRVEVFQMLLEDDKRKAAQLRHTFHMRERARVHRETLVEDSYDMVENIVTSGGPVGLKGRFQITFVNKQGLEEAGVDGGGVFKEFIDSLTKEAFSPQYALFSQIPDDGSLYPSPSSHLAADRFRFLGRILGKAVYEEMLVEPQFATFFLNKLLGRYNTIDELRTLDSAMYRNLLSLKDLDEGIEDLHLTFSVVQNDYGQNVTRELCPGGNDKLVTRDNRIHYIHLMAHYKLNVETASQSRAFLMGFGDVIPMNWIRLFNPRELQMLIGGSSRDVDINDWVEHTVYSGGYHPSQPLIQWFWEVVREFTPEERAALMKFITSCPRQPLLGFRHLNPQICIHQVRISDDERLPSSATCMNLLKLPTYSSKLVLREKLRYAILSKAGFELS